MSEKKKKKKLLPAQQSSCWRAAVGRRTPPSGPTDRHPAVPALRRVVGDVLRLYPGRLHRRQLLHVLRGRGGLRVRDAGVRDGRAGEPGRPSSGRSNGSAARASGRRTSGGSSTARSAASCAPSTPMEAMSFLLLSRVPRVRPVPGSGPAPPDHTGRRDGATCRALRREEPRDLDRAPTQTGGRPATRVTPRFPPGRRRSSPRRSA